MNSTQIKALSDAYVHSGVGQTGLVRESGKSWGVEGSLHSTSHSHNTVRALVERGYLQLYVKGTVAHITDSGIEAVEAFKAIHAKT